MPYNKNSSKNEEMLPDKEIQITPNTNNTYTICAIRMNMIYFRIVVSKNIMTSFLKNYTKFWEGYITPSRPTKNPSARYQKPFPIFSYLYSLGIYLL